MVNLKLFLLLILSDFLIFGAFWAICECFWDVLGVICGRFEEGEGVEQLEQIGTDKPTNERTSGHQMCYKDSLRPKNLPD